MSQPMRRSMTIHRSRATPYRHTQGRSGAAGADAGAILTIVQVCVCMVALVVVFTLQFLDEERYVQAGELYQAVMGGGEGEAVFVGAFGTPITKDTLEGYAQELWALAQPDEAAAVPEPPDVQPDTPQQQNSSSLGQGGESPFLPQNLYLGQVALLADPTYPVYGTVTSPFGLRTHPTSGKADFHTGLDIAAKAEADIYAVLPGVVTEAGQSPIYGNYIRVDHGGGVVTVYNHCSATLAQEGMVVRRGQRIAQVGSTGVSTGPHLHLDLFINGDYADPMQLFKELLEK